MQVGQVCEVCSSKAALRVRAADDPVNSVYKVEERHQFGESNKRQGGNSTLRSAAPKLALDPLPREKVEIENAFLNFMLSLHRAAT